MFPQPFLHRVWPKARGPARGSRSALIVVAHAFSWLPVRLGNMRGGVVRSRSLISSPSGLLRLEPGVKTSKRPNGEGRTRGVYYRLQLSALIVRKKGIRRASGMGGILLVNG